MVAVRVLRSKFSDDHQMEEAVGRPLFSIIMSFVKIQKI